MVKNQTVLTKDTANKKIVVDREFEGSLADVWDAWTTPEILDEWWAPRPWKAVTKTMDFREGGHWLYYMEGPDGSRHYCRADYQLIVPQQRYTDLDAFCDENGVPNNEFPRLQWDINFSATETGTKVHIEITFAKVEDLHTIIEMGFEQGFTAAHGNLDELLAKK